MFTITLRLDGKYIAEVFGKHSDSSVKDTFGEAMEWIIPAAKLITGETITRSDIRYFEIEKQTFLVSVMKELPH